MISELKVYILLGLMAFCLEGYANNAYYPDSISRFHELVQVGNDKSAAELAFEIGVFYAEQDSFAIARKYYNYARNHASKSKQKIVLARATYKEALMGKKMAESGRFSLSEEIEINEGAIQLFQKAHNYFNKAKMKGSYEDVMALVNGGEMQLNGGEFKDASRALELAYRFAQNNRYNDLAQKSCELLVSCYVGLNDDEKEAHYISILSNYEEFFTSKDSLQHTVEMVEKLQTTNDLQKSAIELQNSQIENMNLKLESELARAEMNEAIIRRNRLERKVMFGGIGITLLLLIGAIIANQYKRRTNRKLAEQNRKILEQNEIIEKRQKELKSEKSKSDRLLLNILPAPIADELRKDKKVQPRYYKKVTILFTDFKGFTKISTEMSPGEIVRELGECFEAFDQIIENYESSVGRKCIEKIKTIGDGYMCAGGIPIENDQNPLDVVRVGLAFVEYMEKRKIQKSKEGKPCFEIRVGINTGSIVAGVVGKKKFAYDIWGDAVNLASRMESSGEAGRVNISEETYQYIKDQFFFTSRGKILAKNRGEVEMYFVEGRIKYADSTVPGDSISAI